MFYFQRLNSFFVFQIPASMVSSTKEHLKHPWQRCTPCRVNAGWNLSHHGTKRNEIVKSNYSEAEDRNFWNESSQLKIYAMTRISVLTYKYTIHLLPPSFCRLFQHRTTPTFNNLESGIGAAKFGRVEGRGKVVNVPLHTRYSKLI